MKKELIISIIIIAIIIFLNVFTQGYTKKVTWEITQDIDEIKTHISKSEYEKSDVAIKTIDEKWKKEHDRLAYYIEHNELEKVDLAIVEMKSFFDSHNYSLAIAEIEEAKFILQHIEDKNSFNLQNIF